MTNKKKSIYKTLTWRVTATTTTLLLVFFTTGEFKAAGMVALFEIVVKTTLYYLHERFWASVEPEEIVEELKDKVS